jgi:uncharacterized protein YdeI (YjbR/CyaY-like superfamily)
MEVEVASRAELRDWLTAHAGDGTGVWLVTWKTAAGARHVPYSEVVDECLSFGWVDSLPRTKDAERSMLWISPRRPGSNWSRVNKDKVARLTAAGLMTERGLAIVRQAQADGSWTALDDVENLVVPPDLGAALDGQDGARAVWDGFPRSVRRGALEQLLNARRPETRAARIATILDAISAGERPFQWRKR